MQSNSNGALSLAFASVPSHMAPSAWNSSGHRRWIFMKFDVSVFFENLPKNPRFMKR
jgi:hypothetical protein